MLYGTELKKRVGLVMNSRFESYFICFYVAVNANIDQRKSVDAEHSKFGFVNMIMLLSSFRE